MFLRILFVILIYLAVNLGFPMDMLVQSVAESNSFDDFDNYIPRYDDLPNYNHPSLNHVKNESHIHFNSSNDDTEEEPTTPFLVRLKTTVEGIPTLELDDSKIVVQDNIQDVINTTNSLLSDFENTEKPPNILVITVTPTYVETSTNTDDINVIDKFNKTGSNPIDNKDEDLGTDSNEISTTTVLAAIGTTNDIIVSSEKIDLQGPTEKTNTDVSQTTQKELLPTEKSEITEINNTFNISEVDNPINETTRNPREETEKDDPEFAEKDKESQEDGSSSEEDEEEDEDMNMITGLLSAVLGGLSKPDGGIDLEAIVGLVGSLSTQNDDGSYDFQGLTDLLKGFFGGGADGGGGSDIGAFTGGLLGAVIKGIANPPGGMQMLFREGKERDFPIRKLVSCLNEKGVGILVAKILGGILPALSVQPPDDSMAGGKPSFVKPGGLDIGGFLGGFVKTLLGASKDVNPAKFLISTITSLSNSKPNQPKGKQK